MRNHTLIRAACAATLLFLAGCQIWNPGGKPFTGKDGAFNITVPSDWSQSTLGAEFVASKEGVILQHITVESRALKEPLKSSKRALKPDLAPFELAEAVADDLRANRELLSLEVKENSPVTLGGQPAFRLLFTFRTEQKLRLTEEVYGCIRGDKLWLVHYRAPSRHYFERDRAVFTEAMRTFAFGPLKAAPAR